MGVIALPARYVRTCACVVFALRYLCFLYSPQVNEQCQFCLPENPHARLPAPAPANGTSCNDYTDCTFDDVCTDRRFCIGTLYNENTTCLSDVSMGPACEECDGRGGCRVKGGYFLWVMLWVTLMLCCRLCHLRGATRPVPLALCVCTGFPLEWKRVTHGASALVSSTARCVCV